MSETLQHISKVKFNGLDDIFQGIGSGPRDRACPVCQEDFKEDTQTLTHQICSRSFCRKCLEFWVESLSAQHVPVTCPICRAVLRQAPSPSTHSHHGDFEVSYTEISPYTGEEAHHSGVINWGADSDSHDGHDCVHWSLVYRDLLRDSPTDLLRSQIWGAVYQESLWYDMLLNSVPEARMNLSLSPANDFVPVAEVVLDASPEGGIQVERFPYMGTSFLLNKMMRAPRDMVEYLLSGARVPFEIELLNELRKWVTLPKIIYTDLRRLIKKVKFQPHFSNTLWIYVDWVRNPYTNQGELISIDVREGDCTGRGTDLVFFWAARNPGKHLVQLPSEQITRQRRRSRKFALRRFYSELRQLHR
ncbi:MAG: hypothetical protein Q9227_002157 [Pyrenula ochraceoflavens]